MDTHKLFNELWNELAEAAKTMLIKETLSVSRDLLENFIVRATHRSLRHLREADTVRRRGHK